MSANVVAAIALVNDIIGLVVRANQALLSIQAVQAKAVAEGRDITDEELDAQRQLRFQVSADLDAEIQRRNATDSV